MINEKSLQYVDKILGTNLTEEMKQQQPKEQLPTTTPQQPKPQTEKEQLKEQLELLKLKRQLIQEQKKQEQQNEVPTTTAPQPSIIPRVQQPTGELFNSDLHIHKKQAAIEVLRQLSKSKIQSFVSIGGMFVTAITSVFSSYGGAAVAGVFTVGLAFVLYKDLKYTKYLQTQYDIVPQKKWV